MHKCMTERAPANCPSLRVPSHACPDRFLPSIFIMTSLVGWKGLAGYATRVSPDSLGSRVSEFEIRSATWKWKPGRADPIDRGPEALKHAQLRLLAVFGGHRRLNRSSLCHGLAREFSTSYQLQYRCTSLLFQQLPSQLTCHCSALLPVVNSCRRAEERLQESNGLCKEFK